MAFKSRHAWFLAFVAVFAAAAGFVFWGTWALDMVPVMPDCPTSFPADYAADWLRGWEENGKFVPGDVLPFLGGHLPECLRQPCEVALVVAVCKLAGGVVED